MPLQLQLVEHQEMNSGLSLTRAVRLPLARYLETHDGTFPEAKRLTMSLRLELIEVGTGTSAASNKC